MRRDATPRDAGPNPDGQPPDVPRNLVAEFTADGGGNGVLSLRGLDSEPGELRLQVWLPEDHLRETWGVALHINYDRNLLRFIEAELPNPTLDFAAREIAPGRLALGRVVHNRGQREVAILRFGLVGRGVGRVDLPTRFRTLRDSDNRPIDAGWAGGSVQVVER